MAQNRLRRSLRVLALLLALTCVPQLAAAAEPPPHPLDPLSVSEIAAVGKVIRENMDETKQFPEDSEFAMVALREPPKSEVLDWERRGGKNRRRALAVLYSTQQDRTVEVIVDVSRPEAPKIERTTERPDVQPMMLDGEDERAAEMIEDDDAWKEALKKRNIDPRDVALDVWAVGLSPQGTKPRVFRAIAFFQGDAVNYYDRPIEGLEALVEMGTGKVEVKDVGQGEPVPANSLDFNEDAIRRTIGLREPPKPLHIVQPQGPSFEVNGQEVRWQKWRFRWQMHPREGLVVHQLRYTTRGKDGKPQERSVLYRGSLSEMAVPYGDPREGWNWRCAFDVGEYGIGKLAVPLTAGLDVPENAVLLDAVMANGDGRPRQWPRAVALYERDGGILWKHTTDESDDTRRGRELVIMSISTVGNYDYGVFWILKQDGTIEVEAGLTGIMLVKGVKDGGHDSHTHLVAPNVAAVHHQHILSFRLDLDVDGPVNSVYSMNTFPGENSEFPFNEMVLKETVFERELAARENLNMATARTWRVGNPKSLNGLGHERSFILVGGGNSLPLVGERAPARARGRFMDYHLWVTQYAPDELYAAGDYPNQSKGEEGLPAWTKADRKVQGEDVVLWYTMNVTHIPRPEEWPMMSTTRYGLKLLPAGFFEQNPAMDVPLPR